MNCTVSFKATTNTPAPLKLLSRKRKRLNSKTWINKGILISIKRKRKLYWRGYVNENEVAKSLYKIYANIFNKLFVWQHSYTFLSNCNSINMTFKLPTSKQSINSIPHESYDSNGKLTRNQEEITNQFYQFFATIGL